MKIKQLILIAGLFISLIGGLSVYSEPLVTNQIFSNAVLTHTCAPWDGAAVGLYLNNNKTFPYISFSFYTKLENFNKDNVKNLKFKFSEADYNNNLGATRYCGSDYQCETPLSSEVVFDTLSITGKSKGRYKLQFKNRVLEGSFSIKSWDKQERVFCG